MTVKKLQEAREQLALFQAFKPGNARDYFYQDKASLAVQEVRYLLMQQSRLYQKGFPCSSQPCWKVTENKLLRLKRAMVALFRQNPGYILSLSVADAYSVVWFLLDQAVTQLNRHALMWAVCLLDECGEDEWLQLACRAENESIAPLMEALVFQGKEHSGCLFTLLKIRGEMTVRTASVLLADDKVNVPELSIRRFLATQNHSASIEWINERELTFESLVSRPDKCTLAELASSHGKDAALFDQILNNNLLPVELHHKISAIAFGLAGEPDRVAELLTRLESYLEETAGKETEELVIEPWISAMYLIFGDELPVKPYQAGNELSCHEALFEIKQWWEEYSHEDLTPGRMGSTLSFHNAITALQSPYLDADFRRWIWMELCLLCDVYFPWHSWWSEAKQLNMLSGFRNHDYARERFNLRGQNATLEY